MHEKTEAEFHDTIFIENIAHKYQKIQEIITNWKDDGGAFEMSESYWLNLISEVTDNEDDN